MWYVARGDQTVGPVSFDQLQAAARDGQLRRDDFLWTEGMEQWAAAFTVANLWPPEITDQPPKIVSPAEATKTAPVVEAAPPSDPEPPAADAPVVAQEVKRPNFLLRHWRGELTLVQAYWGVGLLVTVTAIAVGLLIGKIADPTHIGAQNHGILVTSFLFFICVMTLWQIVGVWRSAGNHIRSTKRYFWATVARLVVVLAALRSVVDFVNIVAPILSESTKLAVGVDTTPTHQLRLLRGATELELSGGMNFGTAAAINQLLDAAPTVKVIHLNSQGGRVAEGYEIYKIIRNRKLITYTSTDCASACTIAFLAGPQRYLAANAHLGFHSANYGGLDETALPGINNEIRETLRQHGVHAWFIEKALATRGDSIWRPTNEELIQAGVVTKIVDASQFGLSGVAGWNDREAVERQLLQQPIYKTIKENDPEGFKAIAERFFEGVQAGRSRNEIANDAREVLGNKVLLKYLTYGPDAELVVYWKTQVAEMQHLEASDPVRCVEFLFPELRRNDFDLTKLIPDSLRAQDESALGSLIRATAHRSVDSQGPSVQTDVDAIVASMLKANPNVQSIFGEPTKYTNQPKLLCSTLTSLYRKILMLPPSRSGPILRYIMK